MKNPRNHKIWVYPKTWFCPWRNAKHPSNLKGFSPKTHQKTPSSSKICAIRILFIELAPLLIYLVQNFIIWSYNFKILLNLGQTKIKTLIFLSNKNTRKKILHFLWRSYISLQITCDVIDGLKSYVNPFFSSQSVSKLSRRRNKTRAIRNWRTLIFGYLLNLCLLFCLTAKKVERNQKKT